MQQSIERDKNNKKEVELEEFLNEKKRKKREKWEM